MSLEIINRYYSPYKERKLRRYFMKIFDIFDAAKSGSLSDMLSFYDGNINQIDKYSGLNLLCMAMTNVKNESDKVEIISFLIKEGIDINFCTKRDQRNALHYLYYCNMRFNPEYMLTVTNLLLSQNIDVNQIDKYGHIPLFYLLSLHKMEMDDITPLCKILLQKGSDYRLEDKLGKSCVSISKEYSWNNGFLNIVEEFENGNQ